MSEMKELITVEQAERALALIAVALPALGLLVGAVAGAIRRRLAADLAVGLLCGLAGPAIWVLWRMYSGISGHYGLDSVRGLLINLALFLAIGLVIGLALGVIWRRRAEEGTRGAAEPGKRG